MQRGEREGHSKTEKERIKGEDENIKITKVGETCKTRHRGYLPF